VRYATIFVFPPPARGKAPVVSTSPERLTVRAGDAVEWTVVNATGTPGKVSVGWAKTNPLKGTSSEPFERRTRDSVRAKAEPGLYKYNVLLDGKVVFDPELEIMS
jgi:plastocyanin